jgi:hypothetical protein
MIKYGVLLPWTGQPQLGVRREYPLTPEDHEFATQEMDRWITQGYAEEITEAEAQRVGLVVSGFVVHGSKPRVVIDYTPQNEHLETRKFRMDTLADLAPQLLPEDVLLKADVRDAYYHLGIRSCNQNKLLFRLGGRFFRPLALNCGLSPAPRLFNKFRETGNPCTPKARTQPHQLHGRYLRRSTSLKPRSSRDSRRRHPGGRRDMLTVQGLWDHPPPEEIRLLGE